MRFIAVCGFQVAAVRPSDSFFASCEVSGAGLVFDHREEGRGELLCVGFGFASTAAPLPAFARRVVVERLRFSTLGFSIAFALALSGRDWFRRVDFTGSCRFLFSCLPGRGPTAVRERFPDPLSEGTLGASAPRAPCFFFAACGVFLPGARTARFGGGGFFAAARLADCDIARELAASSAAVPRVAGRSESFPGGGYGTVTGGSISLTTRYWGRITSSVTTL